MRQGCRGGVELPRQRHEDVGQVHLDQKQPSERWRVRLLLASGLGGGLSLELSALLLRLARRPQVSYPGSRAGGSRPRKWDPLSGLRSATAQPGTWATTSAVRASVSASFCPTIARGTPRTARSRGWGAPPAAGRNTWARRVGKHRPAPRPPPASGPAHPPPLYQSAGRRDAEGLGPSRPASPLRSAPPQVPGAGGGAQGVLPGSGAHAGGERGWSRSTPGQEWEDAGDQLEGGTSEGVGRAEGRPGPAVVATVAGRRRGRRLAAPPAAGLGGRRIQGDPRSRRCMST